MTRLPTYILLDVISNILWELQPAVLVGRLDGNVSGMQCILKLEPSLHSGNMTVISMFQNIRQLLQKFQLEEKNKAKKY